jgi:hypothetical protein
MGLFTDKLTCSVGEHVIEVEASSTAFGSECSLFVDNARVDSCKVSLGSGTLRGFVDGQPLIVTVKQGILGSRYQLTIGGQEYKFQKVH